MWMGDELNAHLLHSVMCCVKWSSLLFSDICAQRTAVHILKASMQNVGRKCRYMMTRRQSTVIHITRTSNKILLLFTDTVV